MIDEKLIRERIATLEQQRDELKANIFAVEGAIQDCYWFLGQLGADDGNDDCQSDN